MGSSKRSANGWKMPTLRVHSHSTGYESISQASSAVGTASTSGLDRSVSERVAMIPRTAWPPQNVGPASCKVGQHVGVVVELGSHGFAQVGVVPVPAIRVAPPAVGRRQNLLCFAAFHGSNPTLSAHFTSDTAQNVYIILNVWRIS